MKPCLTALAMAALIGCAHGQRDTPRPPAGANVRCGVFAALLDSLAPGPGVAYLASRTTGLDALTPLGEEHTPDRIARFQRELGVPLPLVQQLFRVSAAPRPHDPADFLGQEIQFVSVTEATRLRLEGHGILELSEPAFNVDTTTAVVYGGWRRTSFGRGQVFRLERANARWEVRAAALSWMM